MFEPYKTTYGSLVNISKLTSALSKYVNTVNLNEIEYEYPVPGDTRCVYVTGYNDEEKELPAWEHPLVMDTLKGHKVVVTDLRKYVNKTTELEARLSDITKNPAAVEFMIVRALLTVDFINNDWTQHRSIVKPTATAMGVWLSGMAGTISLLTPEEMFNIEIITAMYANLLYYPKGENNRDNIDTVIARVVSSKRAFKLSNKLVKERCNKYIFDGGTKLEELVLNIANSVSSDKAKFYTIDSIIGVMGKVWFGPGQSETPIIALENMPTWIALVYAATTSRNYQKARIGMLLSKNSRTIDAKAIEKHISMYINTIKVS